MYAKYFVSPAISSAQLCFLKNVTPSSIIHCLFLDFKQGRSVSLMFVERFFKIENNSLSNIRNKQRGVAPQLGLAFKLGSS